MRVGIVQSEPVFGRVSENLDRVFDLMGAQSADLWILPEFFATGYQFIHVEEVTALGESVPGGRTTETLTAFCRDHDCYIIAGLPEAADEVVYNAAVFVGPTGLVARYRKIHLFGKEKIWFAPGNLPFSVHEIRGARIGVMICFDHFFPESARSLALLGADVIAHPSNLVLPDLAQRTMAVRALENGVYTATANRVGSEARNGNVLRYTGASQIVSPNGDLLVRLSSDRVETAIVEIDVAAARSKRLTAQNDKLADRRPEMYVLGPSERGR